MVGALAVVHDEGRLPSANAAPLELSHGGGSRLPGNTSSRFVAPELTGSDLLEAKEYRHKLNTLIAKLQLEVRC